MSNVVTKDFNQRERIKADIKLAALRAKNPEAFESALTEMLGDMERLIPALERAQKYVPNASLGQVPSILLLAGEPVNKVAELAACVARMDGTDPADEVFKQRMLSYFPTLNQE